MARMRSVHTIALIAGPLFPGVPVIMGWCRSVVTEHNLGSGHQLNNIDPDIRSCAAKDIESKSAAGDLEVLQEACLTGRPKSDATQSADTWKQLHFSI